LRLKITIALVVQISVRISLSKARNGTNSGQAFSHSLTMAGYFASQCPLNSVNASSAAASDGAVYTGLRARAMASQSRRLA
jgi:hypothetical protein